MQDYPATGLRERKKVATRLAIEQAAVEVACEKGYDATTAEAVAAKADVSLRTFYNYFPSKDSAIIGKGMGNISESRAYELLERCKPNILKAMAQIAEEAAAGEGVSSQFMGRRRELMHSHPTLLQRHLAAIDEFESEMARIVASYLRDRPSRRSLAGKVPVEDEARLAVALVGAALRYGAQVWLQTDQGTSTRAEIVQNTMDMMAQIYGRNT